MLKRSDNNICSKRFCEICKQNREVGHLCYIGPLKDVLPVNADKLLNVFYDFETTQNYKYFDKAKAHVSYLVCVHQYCARCADVEDDIYCVRYGKRRHSVWVDRVGDLLTYLSERRPWALKLSRSLKTPRHSTRTILNRAILLKLKPVLITKGLK